MNKRIVISVFTFSLLATMPAWGQTEVIVRKGTKIATSSTLRAKISAAIRKYKQVKREEYTRYLRDAAKGDAEAMYQLGECYRWEGSAVKCNDTEAKKWYLKAAEKGLAQAMYQIGIDCKTNGYNITESDAKQRMEWFHKSAEAGCTKAMCELGKNYINGYNGAENDGEKGIVYYLTAAEKGDIEAMGALGICYQFGKGTEIDKPKAHEWYKNVSIMYPVPQLTEIPMLW